MGRRRDGSSSRAARGVTRKLVLARRILARGWRPSPWGPPWVVRAEPDWYDRLRYPLRYEQIVRGHAENYGSIRLSSRP